MCFHVTVTTILFGIQVMFLASFLKLTLSPYFWLHCTACGILDSPARVQTRAPVVERQSSNHWTAREFFVTGSHW